MNTRETIILVTGADGFVGTHVCRALTKHYTVYAFMLPSQVDVFKTKWGSLDYKHLKILSGTFKELGQLTQSLAPIQYVVHCAGTMLGAKYDSYLESNLVVTQELLAQLPKNLKKIIFLSSQSALGPSDSESNKLRSSATPRPLSFYGETKLLAEKKVLSSGLPSVIFRPAPILGPEDKTFLEIFQTADKGQFPILGQKNKIFQFVHVADLVSAIQTALFSDKINRIYHIAYPETANWNQMQMAIESFLGKPLKILYLNYTLTWLYLKFFDWIEFFTGKKTNKNLNKIDEIMAPYWVFDTTEFTADMNFNYSHNLNETISSTYKWYQQNSWTRPYKKLTL